MREPTLHEGAPPLTVAGPKGGRAQKDNTMVTVSQLSASTACAPNRSLAGAVDLFHRLGFPGIELLAFEGARHSQGDLPGRWLYALGPGELDTLREQFASFAPVTTHSPFIEVRLFAFNPGIRAETRRQLEGTIAGTAALGGIATVVHANVKPFYSLRETWADMVNTFRQLADIGAMYGVQVCVETMYPPTVDQFTALVHEVDHPFFGACVDLGHVAWTVPDPLRGTPDGVALYNDNVNTLCVALGEKLFHAHLHDVRPCDWRDHRACGTGCLDYPRLLDTLIALDYSGPLTLELEEPEVEEALSRSHAFVTALLEKPAASRGGSPK